MIENMVDHKLAKLNELLLSLGSAAVAFSGGVDSTFLAAAAQRVLGDKAVALTAMSATLPAWEKQDADDFAALIGIRHIALPVSELDSSDFVANTKNRCYYCKKTRFSKLAEWAQDNGYQWVLDGSNQDDLSDYRPGMRAVDELQQVRSPLLEVGMTKADIRELSRRWNLPTWDKPSAACLSSRIAYGTEITEDRLSQVEQAEACIRRFCQGQVRVRHHGDLARIEVAPVEAQKLLQPDVAAVVAGELKKFGFDYVTIDIQGYRTGSMNETLKQTV